jgi:hypothetical protein
MLVIIVVLEYIETIIWEYVGNSYIFIYKNSLGGGANNSLCKGRDSWRVGVAQPHLSIYFCPNFSRLSSSSHWTNLGPFRTGFAHQIYDFLGKAIDVLTITQGNWMNCRPNLCGKHVHVCVIHAFFQATTFCEITIN